MELRCMINGVKYGDNLVQGVSFTENYSDMLDSGSVVLAFVNKIQDLEPYDDVYIWAPEYRKNSQTNEMEEIPFNGCYGVEYKENGEIDEENSPETYYVPKFYKHMLVDRFVEEINILNDIKDEDGNYIENSFTYKIELFSETKMLEKIILPNISITQPLNFAKKISSTTYMERFLNMYSPEMRIGNIYHWTMVKKYTLSNQVKELFKNHYTYDFSLNEPTLRELLAKIMVAKDCIPYVKDDKIYALNLSKTRGEFDINKINMSNIVANKTSDGYATQLRTKYSNGLSKDGICHRVEYLGFRNSDQSIFTIENMKLETQFPIYKINKVYVKYKKFIFGKKVGASNPVISSFTCTQDITDFVILNNERNALYKDPRMIEGEKLSLRDKMSKCYFCTLGYSIGGKEITGFGEKFKGLKTIFQLFTWNEEDTIIHNLITTLDKLEPYGIELNEEEIFAEKEYMPSLENQETNLLKYNFKDFKLLTNFSDNESISQKGLQFIVDYQAFYDGALVTSKIQNRGGITSPDNQSSSMPYLDLDGIAKKTKLEKMGNKVFNFKARFRGEEIDKIGKVGQVIKLPFDEDDNIIYQMSYSIYDNLINVNYAAQKNFVLKNYFTSIYAKQRLFNVLDYGETIERCENVRDIVLLSKNKQYDLSGKISFNLKNLLSFFQSREEKERKKMLINMSHIQNVSINPPNNSVFTDTNVFSFGTSIVFNQRMSDNISMGTYIVAKGTNTHISGDIFYNPYSPSKEYDEYRGTLTQLVTIYDDYETARIAVMSFCFGNDSNLSDKYKVDFYPFDKVVDFVPNVSKDEKFAEMVVRTVEEISNNSKEKEKDILEFPKKTQAISGDTLVSKKNHVIYKDNKEVINMSLQIDILNDNEEKDILLSDQVVKLSDLYGAKEKRYVNAIPQTVSFYAFQYREHDYYGTGYDEYLTIPCYIFKIPKFLLKNLEVTNQPIGIPLDGKTFSYQNNAKGFGLRADYPGEEDLIMSYEQTFTSNPEYIFEDGRKMIKIQMHVRNRIKTKLYGEENQEYNTYMYMPLIQNYSIKDKEITSDKYDEQNDYMYFSNVIMEKDGASGKYYYTPQVFRSGDYNKYIYTQYGTDSVGRTGTGGGGLSCCAFSTLNMYSMYWSRHENNSHYVEMSSYSIPSISDVGNNFYLSTGEYPVGFMCCTVSKEEIHNDLLNEKYQGIAYFPTSKYTVVKEQGSNEFIERGKKEDEDGNIIDNEKELIINLSKINQELSADKKPYKSVQFWYYDKNEYNYTFICGFNVSDEEFAAGKIKLYVTVTDNLDTRIFNRNRLLVGNLENLVK